MSSQTITGNIPGTSPLVLCDNSGSVSCADFNYFVFSYDSSNPKSLYYSDTFNYSFVETSSGETRSGKVTLSPFSSNTYVDFSDFSFSRFQIIAPNISDLVDSDHPLTVDFTDSLGSGITPSGSLSITENGTYDVTNYASAVVDVPQTSDNPYHDDLQEIKGAIIIGCAVLLVLYFFYCIYRMIIKSTGGQ